MVKNILTFSSLFFINTSVYSMDLNETILIINKASEATQGLQDKFQALINESVETNTSKILKSKDNNVNTLDNNITKNIDLGTSSKGLHIFKTRIKPYCQMAGDKFSKQYTQEDWEDIYNDKEFKMEVLRACPDMRNKYQDKWTPNLYQFAIEYASDSDAIPEC